MTMTEELRNLQKEILRTRRYLSSLEGRLQKLRHPSASRNYAKAEERRLARVESEFRRKYPQLTVRRSLLAIVGTEPYNSPSLDKAVTRQIVAERYGR